MADRWGRAIRRFAASIRTRVLVTVAVVLAVGIGGSALVARQVLLASVDDRIQAHLTQEAEELREFAHQGLDPRTGEPFGTDAQRVLTVFLSRTIPSEGEVLVTYVDGRPAHRTAQRIPYRVDTDEALTRLWGTVTQTQRGVVDTPAGPFEYLAVPVAAAGRPSAVFMVGQFRDVVAAEVHETVQVTAWVGLAALVAGLLVAVGLARRILTPVGQVTRTAREITETDLSRRIDVSGHDEVSELAHTFNAMLDRLQAAFDQQRQFVDDAGHELRTPITVIRGHLELLEHGDPDDQAVTVDLVLDELDRMHRIVEDLLVLARAEQPDFVAVRPVDLDDLLLAVQRHADTLSSSHGVAIDALAVGRVQADPQRLTQALIQLVDNAVKHTDPGTPIALGSAMDEHQVRLWVRDEGPGIPAADQERIFDRFARGTRSPRRSDGAGLGLAIVRAIAEAHGGAVDLASAPGRGTTFTLRLPVDHDAAGPPAAEDDDPPARDATTPIPVPDADADPDTTRPLPEPRR